MVRDYIYFDSFKNTNDVYIGQTKCKNVFDRLKQHKRDYFCTIHLYKTQKELFNHKLNYFEHFHIHNYNNEGRYKLMNKRLLTPMMFMILLYNN